MRTRRRAGQGQGAKEHRRAGRRAGMGVGPCVGLGMAAPRLPTHPPCRSCCACCSCCSRCASRALACAAAACAATWAWVAASICSGRRMGAASGPAAQDEVRRVLAWHAAMLTIPIAIGRGGGGACAQPLQVLGFANVGWGRGWERRGALEHVHARRQALCFKEARAAAASVGLRPPDCRRGRGRTWRCRSERWRMTSQHCDCSCSACDSAASFCCCTADRKLLSLFWRAGEEAGQGGQRGQSG